MPIELTAKTNQSPSASSLVPTRAKSIFASVFGCVLLFLFLSPNFQNTHVQRATPLGSDFLQEWTGGYVWSNYREELYETERFVAVQHDPAIVGFEWPAEQFYPMVYPPFYYMLLSPLAALPYQWALVFWMLAIGSAIATSMYLWTSYHPGADKHWGKCLLATLAFYPLLMSLNTAHKSAFLLLILTGTYLLLHHRRSFAAGAVFGLIAFKPHLGLVIGITMLIKRQWSFVAGCAVSVGALLLLSLFAGWDLCQDYFWQCLSMTNYTSTSGYQLTESHSLIGAIGLLFGTESLTASVVFRVLAVSMLALVGIGMRGKLDLKSNRFAMQFSLLVIATILLSPHFYIYDLTIMLLPIGLIASTQGRWQGRREMGGRRQLLLASCVLLFVIAGLSGRIAAAIYVQPTVLILVTTLFVLSTIRESSERHSDDLLANSQPNCLSILP